MFFIFKGLMTEKTTDKNSIRKTYIYYDETSNVEKGALDTFEPITTKSTNYKNWRAILDLKTCVKCVEKHGQIYRIEEIVSPYPPLHINCICDIIIMESIIAGNATKNGKDGSDYWLKHFKELPEYYISRDLAKKAGWRKGKPPHKYILDKMIAGSIYENKNGHLPDAPGRIWYEADINYYEGKRNNHRVIWSNDGLIFVTYDHYVTFYEII